MMKYIFLVALCLLFVTLGSSLSINDSIDKNVIVKEFGNSLMFSMSIEAAAPGDYNVYTLSDVYIDPAAHFYISNDGNYSSDFSITPMNRLLDVDGAYIIIYTLYERGVEKYDRRLGIEVLSLADIVEIKSNKVELNDDVVSIEVTNLKNVELNDLSVTLSSLLFDFETVISLPAFGSAMIEIPIVTEDLKKIKAGVYLVEAIFMTPKGGVFVDGNLYLNEEESVSTFYEDEGFLLRTNVIEKVNTGNTVENVRIEIEKNIFTRFFTTFNEEPLNVVRDGFVVTYAWTETLGPSDVFEVRSSTNYLYPILLLVVIGFVFFGLRRFFMLRLVVVKTVTPVRTKRGEFALRVRLSVTAKKDLENVALIDNVPRTVKIYKKFGLSTPDEIDAVNRRLKWNIGDLNAGEERLFTYVVYSRVGYVGKFVLPPAFAEYDVDENKHTVISNSVFFLAEQTSTVDE